MLYQSTNQLVLLFHSLVGKKEFQNNITSFQSAFYAKFLEKKNVSQAFDKISETKVQLVRIESAILANTFILLCFSQTKSGLSGFLLKINNIIFIQT